MQMTKAPGACVADARADLVHHLGVDGEQVVAAHAGLARHAGGDDHHVRAFDGCIVLGAGERRVEAFHRAALGEVQRLALRHAVHDVEEHDVAEILERGEVGERAADVARADQRDLAACHGESLRFWGVAGLVSCPKTEDKRYLAPPYVMAGLDPAIHVAHGHRVACAANGCPEQVRARR